MGQRRCGHCGREGTLQNVEDVVIASKDATVVATNGQEIPAELQKVVGVACCNVCEGPTFSSYSWLESPFAEPDDVDDLTVIYPQQHSVDALPERVRVRYVAALELLHAPDAFAVRLGRLLEAVCADQGVKKGSLDDRLTELANRGDLPPALAGQAHLVRRYRNLGGHDDDLEVEEDDVPLIRGFSEALLEFLYWGPAKLAQGTADLQRRRDALESSG